MNATEVIEFCDGILGSGWKFHEDLVAQVMEAYAEHYFQVEFSDTTNEQIKRTLTLIMESWDSDEENC